MNSAKSIDTYAQVDRHSQVEGEDRHAMISALLDELLRCMQNFSSQLEGGDKALDARNENYAKALAILHTLQSVLDFDRGGEIAPNLFRIYDFARRELLTSFRNGDAREMAAAISSMTDIRDGWKEMDLADIR